jgi:hypothetical protein
MAVQRLPDAVLTLYAELLDQCVAAEADARASGRQPGSFVSKTIRDATYWYIQRTAGSEKRQTYLGRETPALLKWMRDAGKARDAARTDETRRRELIRMLAAGGAARETGAVAQTLRILADSGMFRGGGVLVGTQAFTCYANMLGVRFDQQSMRTADIDIAHDAAVALAMSRDEPAVDVVGALRASEPRFFAIPGLDPREPSTSLKVRGRDIRIDFLTTAPKRPSSKPLPLPQFGIAAHPLPGIDYLLADATQAVVIGGSGVLVNVPNPARFALHKLWVAQQRNVSEQTKARKDVRQAEQVLEVLIADRPGDVTEAWRAAEERPGFAKVIKAALRRLSIGRSVQEFL